MAPVLSMCPQMFDLIGDLGKTMPTSIDRAYKRLLPSVTSHMIKQIMQLFEHMIAFSLSTFEHTEISLCFNVDELDLYKVTALWDMHFPYKFLQVHGGPLYYYNLATPWLIILLKNLVEYVLQTADRPIKCLL
jgi:hypothetical protein